MANLLKSANEDFSQNPQFVSETIASLTDLSKMGKPQTAAEMQERIDAYFAFCAEKGLRPGIESLALSCGMDRRRFWELCNGKKGAEMQEICQRAKQCIVAFLETSMYSGKLNPPSAIFSLKNIGGWQDSVTVETIQSDYREITADELPVFPNFSLAKKSEVEE
ncbi:MAG: hypothetical protein IKN45_10995 [Lachnospiraceae bacterium]|nr:hypothetical protein [Lachnospiraceae bacterium]